MSFLEGGFKVPVWVPHGGRRGPTISCSSQSDRTESTIIMTFFKTHVSVYPYISNDERGIFQKSHLEKKKPWKDSFTRNSCARILELTNC